MKFYKDICSAWISRTSADLFSHRLTSYASQKYNRNIFYLLKCTSMDFFKLICFDTSHSVQKGRLSLCQTSTLSIIIKTTLFTSKLLNENWERLYYRWIFRFNSKRTWLHHHRWGNKHKVEASVVFFYERISNISIMRSKCLWVEESDGRSKKG